MVGLSSHILTDAGEALAEEAELPPARWSARAAGVRPRGPGRSRRGTRVLLLLPLLCGMLPLRAGLSDAAETGEGPRWLVPCGMVAAAAGMKGLVGLPKAMWRCAWAAAGADVAVSASAPAAAGLLADAECLRAALPAAEDDPAEVSETAPAVTGLPAECLVAGEAALGLLLVAGLLLAAARRRAAVPAFAGDAAAFAGLPAAAAAFSKLDRFLLVPVLPCFSGEPRLPDSCLLAGVAVLRALSDWLGEGTPDERALPLKAPERADAREGGEDAAAGVALRSVAAGLDAPGAGSC
jgi:hypothetical protein